MERGRKVEKRGGAGGCGQAADADNNDDDGYGDDGYT